jgi:hypothetical protein
MEAKFFELDIKAV